MAFVELLSHVKERITGTETVVHLLMCIVNFMWNNFSLQMAVSLNRA